MPEATQEKSVLLVDDDAFLRQMYAAKFTQRGFVVTSAENGREAIDKLTRGLMPSIIAFDLIMPDLDGYGFLAEMKNRGLAKNAAKIALSNESASTDLMKLGELGADGHAMKAAGVPSQVVDEVIRLAESKHA